MGNHAKSAYGGVFSFFLFKTIMLFLSTVAKCLLIIADVDTVKSAWLHVMENILATDFVIWV